jgi:hypothetical protein
VRLSASDTPVNRFFFPPADLAGENYPVIALSGRISHVLDPRWAWSCRPGIIWTRNRQEPDQVPRICDWFAEDGFALVWVSDPAEGWGVGAHRFTANPVPLERGARMFRFIRRPRY